jgi:SnoaL-like domain
MQPHPLRTAVEARDIDRMIDALAPDVVFHSPLISERFEGREQVGNLFRVLADAFLFNGETRYTDEIAERDTVMLVFTARVDGQPVQGVDLLRNGADGRIREMTVFLRPLPGTATVAATLAPRMAGRGSRARASFAALGAWPLSAMAKAFDAVGSRTARAGR